MEPMRGMIGEPVAQGIGMSLMIQMGYSSASGILAFGYILPVDFTLAPGAH